MNTSYTETERGLPELQRRVLGQSSLIFSGFAAAQAMSFLRNSLIGHTLSRDDFGIAATITLTIQLVETLSDLGADRQIVQDKDGDQPAFVANAHGLLIGRGVLLALLILLATPLLTSYFNIPEATFALQLAALVPLIKAGVHLDYRRAQRELNNRPQVLVELIPQAVALALTLPALAYFGDFSVAAYLAIGQALAMLIASHLMARSAYHIAFDAGLWRKQLAFGLPILASALPLAAVYHGDRIIIGRVYDMSAVGAYTAALMLTMVPALLVSRFAHAVMLPVFSEKVRKERSVTRAFAGMTELIVMLAASFAILFGIAGGEILVVAFGEAYRNLGALVAAFAAMWAIRMTQTVPGMALMAHGQTTPFAIAGCLRAMSLPCVAIMAANGFALAALAAIGAVFECAALVYISLRLDRAAPGLASHFAKRVTLLIPALALPALLTANHHNLSGIEVMLFGAGLAVAMTALTVLVFPNLRRMVARMIAGLSTKVAPSLN